MKRLPSQIVYGTLATFSAAAVALDAQGAAHEYPIWHALFGNGWIIARSLWFGIFSAGAATFGYLALHVKENPK